MNHILRPSPEMTAICAELGGHGMSSSSSVRLLLLLLFAGFIGSVAEAQSTSFSSYGANGAQFNSSMAIIVVVLISVFFVMGFLSIYLRQCSERDEVSLARNGAGGTRWMRAPRGLDPALIETFPKLMYADVKDHKLGKGALECAVCLSEFDDDDSLRLLPKCDHVFHTECIDAWLASHTTCPVCRADLLSNSDEQQPLAVASPLPDAAAPPVSPPDHVVITVDESLPRKASLPPLPPNPDRTPRRPKAATRFPRSNSTGHSIVLVHAADDCDRFTLRLPEHIRRDVINGNLRRSTSFVVFPQQEEGSSRGGRSSKLKPERWSFFSKTFSTRSPRRDTGAGEGSTRRVFFFSPRRDVGAGEGGSTRRGAEMAGDGRSVESNQDLSSVRNLPFDKPPS